MSPAHAEQYDPDAEEAAAKTEAVDYLVVKHLPHSKFATLLRTRQSWAEQKKEAMARMEALDKQLGKLLALADAPAVRCNDHTVILHVNKTYTKLSETLLLQNGVSATTIAKSRETTTKKPYLQVYPPRGGKKKEDE